MATPDLSVGGFPRYPIFGNVAVRLDTGALELWDGTSAWGAVGGSGGPPAGSVVAWPNATPPSGWLVCDGSAVSRATYAALFAITGTAFGVGDGSTTFNLPDLRDRFVKGENGDGVAASGGSSSPSVSDPGHTHTVAGGAARQAGASNTATGPQTSGSSVTGLTIPDGRPPYLVFVYVIKT